MLAAQSTFPAESVRMLVDAGASLNSVDATGLTSRQRDCHFADIPSPFSRRFNTGGEGVPAKNDGLADGQA